MGITIKTLLNNGPLKNARLIAGQSGIHKKVKFVNIMEVPRVVKWLQGGELLLTTGYAFKDDKELKNELIYKLDQKGVTAVGIKLGEVISEIPQEMVIQANNVNMPLIEIPSHLPYSRIMQPIFEILISKQYCKLKKAEEVNEKLFDLLLEGGNIDSIAALLCKMLLNPVIIIDTSMNIRGQGIPDNIDKKTIQDLLFYFLSSDVNTEEIYKDFKNNKKEKNNRYNGKNDKKNIFSYYCNFLLHSGILVLLTRKYCNKI